MSTVKQRLAQRVAHVTKMLLDNGFEAELAAYRPGPGGLTGWYRVRARRDKYTIVVTEYLSEGAIKKYSYTLLANNKPLLRYDNAPRHPEIETHPHHKHVGDRVEPLHNHTLGAFPEEAKQLLEKQSQ